jgi:hypothetical protein
MSARSAPCVVGVVLVDPPWQYDNVATRRRRRLADSSESVANSVGLTNLL